MFKIIKEEEEDYNFYKLFSLPSDFPSDFRKLPLLSIELDKTKNL